MNLLVWLVIGACAGSLVAMTMRQSLGLLISIALGIAGAVTGGILCAPGDLTNAPLTIATFFIPVIGAVLALGIVIALRTQALR